MWYDDRENLAAMVHYMIREGFSNDRIVDAIEKPWKWTPEYESGWKTS